MLEIDRPFEDLDEVWIWPTPHPADPDEPRPHHRVTRIGTREASALVGRVQLRTRPSRTILGPVTRLEGLGPWRRSKLGEVGIRRSDQGSVSGGGVSCGGVRAEWRPRGHFQIGDHEERNQIATGGHPYPPSARELGESALDLGRTLLRRLRDRSESVPPPADSEPTAATGPVEVSAFDGWLVATPVHQDEHLAWRVAVDRHPTAPESVGLGLVLAAIALVHA